MQNFLKIFKKYKFDNIQMYGDNIAKVWDNDLSADKATYNTNMKGKLVLVTAITPTKSGIGKTTVSIGLGDALSLLGKNTILSLREPSMGPVFGLKGGATGGGESILTPEDKIDLHFTGDFHAIAQANNLLASIIDNHIYFGNQLNIDPENIYFKRCLDINDRSLRNISYTIRNERIETGFNITAASEVMAIVALSKSYAELKENLGNILVAKSKDNKPVFASQLNAQNAMSALLYDAMKPNAVFTKHGTLSLVHMGPFANIAHGASSIIATSLALRHSDFCVTEAGFGSDLGGEKFMDITSEVLGKTPDVCVLVFTIKALKEHGNGDLERGFENVKHHLSILKEKFNISVILTLNQHTDDTHEEINQATKLCTDINQELTICNPYSLGGKGCLSLARAILNSLKMKENHKINRIYQLSDSIEDKIIKIAKNVYGAIGVEFSKRAKEKILFATNHGFNNFYVNIAKTPYSFTDSEKTKDEKDFLLKITDIEIRSGAKMIVPICGEMLLMPGLGKNSRYLSM